MLDKQILQQNIVVLLGIQSLSDDKKIALIDKMTELVQKRLTIRVLKLLPDKERGKFFDAVEKDDKKGMDKMLAGKVENMAEMIEEEVLKLKTELKGVAEKIDV